MDYDEAITLAGYGKFHIQLSTVCAISLLSVGFQNSLSSYMFPAAACELHLTSFDLSLLNIAFLLGGILSCFLWGVLADSKGRRPVLLASHFLNFAVTLLLCMIPAQSALILCRFLNGFLIGAPGSVIFTYLAEFQPPKYRSAIVCFSGLFFTTSWLFLPALAYFILPLDFDLSALIFRVNPWRVLVIVVIVPEVVAAVAFLQLPESPKFLASQGRTSEALLILREIYRKNTGRYWKLYPVRALIEGKAQGVLREEKLGMVKKIGRQVGSLFRKPFRYAALLTALVMFANMFGLFGFGLWLPELFVRFERFESLHPNISATVSQLSQLSLKSPAPNTSTICTPSFDSTVIKSTLVLGVTSLTCNALSALLARWLLPLRYILLVAMATGGVTSLAIYWLRSSLQNLVVAALFQGSMVAANMTVGSLIVELLPTEVSAMAICLAICAGRLGALLSNFLFGIFMDGQCEVAIFSVAAVVLGGAVLCYFLPVQTKAEDRRCAQEITTKL